MKQLIESKAITSGESTQDTDLGGGTGYWTTDNQRYARTPPHPPHPHPAHTSSPEPVFSSLPTLFSNILLVGLTWQWRECFHWGIQEMLLIFAPPHTHTHTHPLENQLYWLYAYLTFINKFTKHGTQLIITNKHL